MLYLLQALHITTVITLCNRKSRNACLVGRCVDINCACFYFVFTLCFVFICPFSMLPLLLVNKDLYIDHGLAGRLAAWHSGYW